MNSLQNNSSFALASFADPDAPVPSQESATKAYRNTLPLLQTLSECSYPKEPSELIADYSGRANDQILVDEPHFYLATLPSGKPAPQSFCTKETLQFDDRPRVQHRAAKTENCWYYSFKTIRPWIGKGYLAELVPDRIAEQRIATLRNQLAKFNQNSLLSIAQETFPKEMNRSEAQNTLERWEILNTNFYASIDPIIRKFRGHHFERCHSYLVKFLSQQTHDLFYNFLKEQFLLESNKILSEFLQEQGFTPQQYFALAKNLDPENHQRIFANYPWEQISPRCQYTLLHAYMLVEAARLYQLETSAWSPFQPIEQLISALRERGPHAIGGSFYFPPEGEIESELVAGQPIYSWNTQALQRPPAEAHTITLVGAKKNPDGEDTVYYIDSAQISDPDKPHKIYSLSYSELKSRIYNLLSALPGDMTSSPANYAFIRNTRKK